MSKGKLYIIPVPISEDTLERVVPEFNNRAIKPLRIFVVEKIKTARQFLRKIDPVFPIDDAVFYEQDKHNEYDFDKDVLNHLVSGNNVGLLSESGYPGIADPGSRIVALAHKNNCTVIPLVGPSSIFLALASSGMNGQGFTFHGYLPKDTQERNQKIAAISTDIAKTSFAHIFIETPYRNQSLFDDLLKSCPNEIKLTIAYDITGSNEKIINKTISDWKKQPFKFEKFPSVFILGL